MNLIQSAVLGIVEGITEFLPISSTFHLIWTSRFLGIPDTDFVKLFNVVIQAGAILAVVFLYWKEVLTNMKLFSKLIVSFIPTALVGLFLYDFIKSVLFESVYGTTIVFILVGLIFILIEVMISRKMLHPDRDIEQLSYLQAAGIGLFQAIAVVPGVSRAGAVLIGMMIFGFKRSESAKYSFMLSIPTILAASLFDVLKMKDILSREPEMLPFLGVGTLIACVSAFFCIKWLISYLQHHSLALFGWYRVIFGILLLLFALR